MAMTLADAPTVEDLGHSWVDAGRALERDAVKIDKELLHPVQPGQLSSDCPGRTVAWLRENYGQPDGVVVVAYMDGQNFLVFESPEALIRAELRERFYIIPAENAGLVQQVREHIALNEEVTSL